MPVRRHPFSSSKTPAGVPPDLDLVERLRRSALLLGPPGSRLADRFYDRLFRRDPALRALFPASLDEQKVKLGMTLEFVMLHVGRPEDLVGPLRELGRRHRDYGAKPEHDVLVVDELVGAMADIAGPGWTDDDTEDWRTALRLMGEIMRSGAEA